MKALALGCLALATCSAPDAVRTSVLEGDEIRICLRDDWSRSDSTRICHSSEAFLTADDVLGFERTTIEGAYLKQDGTPWTEYGALRLTREAARRFRRDRSPFLLVSICTEAGGHDGPRIPPQTHPVPLPAWFTLAEDTGPVLAAPWLSARDSVALADGCAASHRWVNPRLDSLRRRRNAL